MGCRCGSSVSPTSFLRDAASFVGLKAGAFPAEDEGQPRVGRPAAEELSQTGGEQIGRAVLSLAPGDGHGDVESGERLRQ